MCIRDSDYITGKSILKLLQDTCREKGVTVIVITHNSALAPMADKVCNWKFPVRIGLCLFFISVILIDQFAFFF